MLEASANPFAPVVLAHLKARQTHNDPAGRHAWKVRLVPEAGTLETCRHEVQGCGSTFLTCWKRQAPEAAMLNGEIIRRRNLPHWDVPTAAYFVTVCLQGSIPARGLLDLQSYRAELEQRLRPADQTPAEWGIVQWKRAFARTDLWLDRAEAVRFLENDALAQIVVDALYFFAGERYDLLGYVVMPNHCHWVFQPLEQWVNGLKPGQRLRTPRQRIVHIIDRFTALRCNQVLGRRGGFWQREAYDHWVRGSEELERILLYIEGNPVKAGLVPSPHEWRHSSAWERRRRGLELGQPLTRPKPAS